MRGIAVTLLVLAVAIPSVRADEEREDSGLLTLDRIFGGPSFTKGIPRWSWRPRHVELVRRASRRDTHVWLPGVSFGLMVSVLLRLPLDVAPGSRSFRVMSHLSAIINAAEGTRGC